MQGPEYDVHDVVVRLGANENRTRVTLGKQLNHVKEVHLNEYAIRNPNGGALTPSLWRFNFNGGDFYSEVTTNAQGSGYPFVIDSATMVHVIYTRPRVMSRDGKGKMALFGLNDTISEVLKLTRLDKLFPIARDRDAALKAVQ